ncbi:hypothetical protein AX15_005943 [Amanita polypyramis BW_CC]|nr:hypothetical protein AX15_005943 [Amanita polypyramis BW_CC]
MALPRSASPLDGTLPVPVLLLPDEHIHTAQDAVGIYFGSHKAPNHQSGTLHLTTHRLFYIDVRNPRHHSFALDLALVVQTDYYAGLFKSSAKVTLHLRSPDTAHSDQTTWECQVCGYKNPPRLIPSTTTTSICSLCGVPRSSHLSTSLPVSSSTSPAPPPEISIACPACTFLNHPSLSNCEICSTPLPPRPATKSAPSSRPGSPSPAGVDDPDAIQILKLSFRKGGDKPFYATLKNCLKAKPWQVGKPLDDLVGRQNTIGISGILHTVQTSAQGEQDHLRDALRDLEALMATAKDMVRLAAELNEKLTAVSSTTTAVTTTTATQPGSSPQPSSTPVPSTEPEEATFIRSSLSQLGLQMANTPVTPDMIKDERKWIEELARELAGVLQGGIMKDRGIIALDEVWGGWNRARGVALIPPSTFLQVVPFLPLYITPTIHMRTLNSGLTVLHTPPYTSAAFASRLSSFLSLVGPQTTTDIALEEGLSVSLIKEMVESVEVEGYVLRDDASAAIVGGGGVSGARVWWWNNVFEGYVWDGQT